MYIYIYKLQNERSGAEVPFVGKPVIGCFLVSDMVASLCVVILLFYAQTIFKHHNTGK